MGRMKATSFFVGKLVEVPGTIAARIVFEFHNANTWFE